MIKYNYNVIIIDKNERVYAVDTVAEMFTEAILKALNKSKLANFDAEKIMIQCVGVYEK